MFFDKSTKAGARGLSLALALWFFLPSIAEAKWNLAVTNPWLASVVSFIGGVNVKVLPLSGWDSEGRLIKLKVKDLDSTKKAMAMDKKEAKAFRPPLGDSIRVETLYRDFSDSQSLALVFSDPGTLPFIGQRVLVAMADLDPDGYEYYQRRLAEFQSRLDSTVSMGRRLLSGGVILDLSGSQDTLFRAAGCTVVSDDQKIRAMVEEASKRKGSERSKALDDIARATREYDVILLDHPSGLKLSLPSGLYPIVVVSPLDVNVDPITVLYDRYLAVWNVFRNRRG